jgi:hypothetical protein
MVDTLTRDLLDSLAGATDAARLALSQAELPDLLNALDGSSSAAVPTALLHDVEEVQNIGGVAHLQSVSGQGGGAGKKSGWGQGTKARGLLVGRGAAVFWGKMIEMKLMLCPLPLLGSRDTASHAYLHTSSHPPSHSPPFK